MRGALILLVLFAAGAFTLEGPAAYGRVAARLGLPALGEALADDAAQQGIFAHQRGAWEDAAELFRAAGAGSTYNRADALARAGRYEASIQAYDAVLARDPADDEARANRALVRSIFPGPQGDPAPGDDVAGDGSLEAGQAPQVMNVEAAAGAGAEAAASQATPSILNAQPGLARRVRRQRENRGVVPDRRWLAALPDQPGRYLQALIDIEHQRRVALGISQPPGEEP